MTEEKKQGANKISEVLREAIDSIRGLADVETVIGDPINAPGGTVIIPVSKVSLGLASGGLDYFSRDKGENGASERRYPSFGGGGGTGLSVTPVAFLVVHADGEVELLNVSSPTAPGPSPDGIEAVGDLLERSPDIIERFKTVFSRKKPDDTLYDDGSDSGAEKDKGGKE